MNKCVFVKSVGLDSAQCGKVEVAFFDDKEWKIIVNCEKTSSGSLSKAKTTKQSTSNADSQITITFFALENDIDSLVCGYFGTFLGLDFYANLKRENNAIFIDTTFSKDEILSRLAQKDIIQSCEQITMSDKKINSNSIIMPFNSSRTKISREILEANYDFFATSNIESGKFLARIVCGESSANAVESFDTNPKNAIYKAIGKALDLSLQGKSLSNQSTQNPSLRDLATPNRGNASNLLDATIFLNFRLEIECLKILILQKCTFIVCAGIPSFSVVRFAQKFGITLIAFAKNHADSGEFFILTHQMRFATRI